MWIPILKGLKPLNTVLRSLSIASVNRMLEYLKSTLLDSLYLLGVAHLDCKSLYHLGNYLGDHIHNVHNTWWYRLCLVLLLLVLNVTWHVGHSPGGAVEWGRGIVVKILLDGRWRYPMGSRFVAKYALYFGHMYFLGICDKWWI